jgi:hypothetical protein
MKLALPKTKASPLYREVPRLPDGPDGHSDYASTREGLDAADALLDRARRDTGQHVPSRDGGRLVRADLTRRRPAES